MGDFPLERAIASRALAPSLPRTGWLDTSARRARGQSTGRPDRAGLFLWRRERRAARHGGERRPGDPGDLPRHGQAVRGDARPSRSPGRTPATARRARGLTRAGGPGQVRSPRRSLAGRSRCLLSSTQDGGARGGADWIRRLDHGAQAFQGGVRWQLPTIEPEWSRGRIKINPLAPWSPADVERYRVLRNLPKHPLADRGFRSIGCAPCTRPVAPHEPPRAGRWWGLDKSECGIHVMDKAS